MGVPIDQRLVLVLSISCLSLYLFLALIKFIYKVWWYPIRIQNLLASQGIKGPAYKFPHGNNKEFFQMIRESKSKPMGKLSHNIFPRLQPHIHSSIQIYGRTFLTWDGPKPLLIVTEPDLIREILNDRDGVFLRMKVPANVKRLFGDSLVTIDGQKWAKQRNIANRAFYAEKSMFPVIITAVETMLERWKHHEGKEIEAFKEFRLLTSDVIARTAFGSNYIEGKNIFDLVNKLASNTKKNSRFPLIGTFFPTQGDIESEKTDRELEKSILEIIKRREMKMKNEELDGYGSDYLGLLIKASHEADESKRISIQDVIDECKTFYFVGHDPTTNLLTWTCLLLAIHTDWQDKARKEVIELLGQNINQTPIQNVIAKFKMMNMIIHESLRLYPPGTYIVRTVGRKARLGPLNLEANTDLKISILALNHDPKIWGKDVHDFKPERFSEGVVKATNNNNNIMAFIPFGYGPHTCVGMKLAMNETKIALAMILQRYYFTLSPTYIHSPTQLALNPFPQHGLQIILHAL